MLLEPVPKRDNNNNIQIEGIEYFLPLLLKLENIDSELDIYSNLLYWLDQDTLQYWPQFAGLQSRAQRNKFGRHKRDVRWSENGCFHLAIFGKGQERGSITTSIAVVRC